MTSTGHPPGAQPGSNWAAQPYIPNSAPRTRRAMLDRIAVGSIDELLRDIPESLRLQRELRLPPPLTSEAALKRHILGLLDRNRPATEFLSFLGHGCYPHQVPAVCAEINQRAEFLTAYAGEPYEDHGKWQAIFEYCSLMAELLEMDVVGVPNYDGYQAVATALAMSLRITGRLEVVVPGSIAPAKLSKVTEFLGPNGRVRTVDLDWRTGGIDCEALASALSADTAAVLVESPNVFGVVEPRAQQIARMAHSAGALIVGSTDPVALGFLDAPASWGADIVCGDLQALGLGMHFGGANGGFIAVHDEERFVFELPTRLIGVAPTAVRGEIGFIDVAYERTSLAMREQGVEWIGTAAALWGITAGVYLSLMGPEGLAELGSTVAAYTRHAMRQLAEIPGVEILFASSPHWREFTVRYDGMSVTEVNRHLLERGILGGADLTGEFPGHGPIAVYCVTELHDVDAIATLAAALREVLS